MVPNSPSFAPLSSPLLKAGARGGCMIVGGALPRPYRALQYLHIPCRGGAVPLPAILQKSHCRRQSANVGGGALPPAFTRGVPPNGGGGSKHMVPNSPSFAPLSSPLLKAGAEGAVHECGRGNAPPLQSFAILHTPCRGGAVPLPAILQKSHCRRQSVKPIKLWAGHCPAPTENANFLSF